MADPAASTVAPSPHAGTEELVRQWIAEIDASEKDPARAKWVERSKAIIKIYKEEAATAAFGTARKRKKFALFWSSVQTVAPAIFARTPTAVVTRRFKDNDPVGRLGSEVLERSINFALDTCDFGSVMLGCRDEFLLVARGQAWVRYVPTLRTADGEAEALQVGDDPAPFEVVDWEDVVPDRLHYEDFLHNPCRSWQEVWWCGRRAFLTRKEGTDRFGEIFAKVPLEWSPPGMENAPDDLKKGAVYEVWDRRTKTVIWLSRGLTSQVLDSRPDPLQLQDFFPCPKPLYGTLGPDSLIPTPDYIYWQDQAEEINNLTSRIDKLIDALRVRGFYSAAVKEDLNTLLKSEDNTLIPVESWAALKDNDGLEGLIAWMPVQQIAEVLKACFDARRQLIEDVFQVTGISDIQRGASDPNETAAAQQIKVSWGSLRVRDRQKELARFARDIIRIMGQIIAAKFDQPTLSAMTGVKLLTAAERTQMLQQIQLQQQAAAQSQPPAMPGAPPAPPPQPPPIPPEVQQQLAQPTWDDVIGMLRKPAQRAFQVDIETDSTIEPNDQEEKQRRIEFVSAVGKYLAESMPVVQAAPQLLPVIIEGLKFLVRGFRVGREMEDIIDRAADALQQAAANPPPQQGQDPAAQAKAQAAQTTAQAHVMQAQNDQQANQIELTKVQSAHAIGMASVQAENMRTQADAHLGIQSEIAKAEDRRAVREMNDQRPIVANTR
jgi:hypothetical protein